MKIQHLFIITLALFTSLSNVACSTVLGIVRPSPSPTATATATATATNTLKPTIPSTPTIVGTATRTPVGPTPVSSNTPSPTLTRTPTRTFTPTPASTATKWPAPGGFFRNTTRVDIKFRSAVLNQDRRLIIYLPVGYNDQATRRYPVAYLLHGYGGWGQPTTEWEGWQLQGIAESLQQKGEIQPMIIVQPDGFMDNGQPSYWFNHEPGTTDGKRWGDYVWQDVVNYIDTNYRTIPNRASRVIAGFSLGGQGALELGMLHSDVFGNVGAHSPSFRGADGSIDYFGSWNYFNQYDPIWLVKNHPEYAKQLKLWMDVGLDDDRVRKCGPDSDRCVEAFEALLNSKNIPHIWHGDWIGKHEGVSYWAPHTADYLRWYSSVLIGQ